MQRFRYALIVALLTGVGLESAACDICGCSNAGINTGWISGFNVNRVGISFQNQIFRSEHPTLFANESPTISTDRFLTIGAHAHYFPGQRLRLSFQMPAHSYVQEETGTRTQNQGIGDLKVGAFYVFQSERDSITKPLFRWTIGGYVKAPTGKSNVQHENGSLLNPNLQMGTGSFDFPLASSLMIKKSDWAVILDVGYRLNLSNKSGYRFGNRLESSARIARWIQIDEQSTFWLRPHVGLSHSLAEKDYENVNYDRINPHSGGYFIHGVAGLAARFNSLVLSTEYRVPLQQSFADDLIRALPSFQIELNFLFLTD